MSEYGLPPSHLDGRERILIADDDASIRRVLGEYLEDEGYIVQLAADGTQALEAATGFSPDLVLMDVTMPGLDGLEVARRLRAGRSERSPRILMQSGLGDAAARSAGLRAGADEYVTKPMRPRELEQHIQALLRHADGSEGDPA